MIPPRIESQCKESPCSIKKLPWTDLEHPGTMAQVMIKNATICLIFLSLTALLSAQDKKPPPESMATARRLIGELSSPSFDVRQKAFDALSAMGREILPLLNGAVERADPEARMRLQGLIAALPEGPPVKAAKLKTSLVSLGAIDETVAEFLNRLERTTPFKFKKPMTVPTQTRIALEMKEMPIFEALDTFFQAASLRWMLDGTGLIRLYKGNGGRPLTLYQGPFRIALNSLSRNMSMTFGLDAAEYAYIQTQIDIEPDAHVVGLWLPCMLDTLIDDTGASLKDSLPVNQNFNVASHRRSFNASLRLTPPTESSQEIRSLKGHFRYAVAESWDDIVLSLAGRDAAQPLVERGNVSAKLSSRVESPSEIKFKVELVRELLYADKDRRRPISEQRFECVDAQGRTILPIRKVSRQIMPKKEVFTIAVPPGEYDRLEIRVLRSIKERRMEFEFKNIPLR